MTSKVIKGHKKSSNFSVNPTLPITFISEQILLRIYMNAKIMNTQIFQFYLMTSKVIEGHKSASNFSINPTLTNTLIY